MAFAQTNKPVDVSSFNIAGVELGMETSVSLNALERTLGLSEENIHVQYSTRSGFGKRPVSASVRQGMYRIFVNYGPATPPKDPLTDVVTAVTYGLRKGHKKNKEALDKMYALAYERYSDPSTVYEAHGGLRDMWEWCGAVKQQGRRYKCENVGGPRLKISGIGLFLWDEGYKERLEIYRGSLQTKPSVEAPKF